jgi:hypothetical protein
MAVILPTQPNKFVFPKTVQPSLNLSHPATSSVAMSAVFEAGSFYNLAQNKFFTAGGGSVSASKINPYIGPCLAPSLSGDRALSVATGISAVPSYYTAAGILIPPSSGLGSLATTNQGGGTGVYITSIGFFIFGMGISNIALTLVAGNPYFVGLSAILGNGNTNIGFAKNLLTGQVQIVTSTNSGAVGGWDINTIIVGGNDNAGDFSDPQIATSMSSRTFLTVPQILQWTEDPWSFWYSRQLDLVDMFAKNTAGFTPLFRKTLSLIGSHVGGRGSQVS